MMSLTAGGTNRSHEGSPFSIRARTSGVRIEREIEPLLRLFLRPGICWVYVNAKGASVDPGGLDRDELAACVFGTHYAHPYDEPRIVALVAESWSGPPAASMAAGLLLCLSADFSLECDRDGPLC